MTTLRRLNLFSFLLALLLTFGAALPSPALWSCRYAAQAVVPAASHPAMPCLMAAPQPEMACCRAEKASVARKNAGRLAYLAAPPCRPTLTRLAASPALSAPDPQIRLRLPSQFSVSLPCPAFCLPALPDGIARRQRPPPVLGVAQSSCSYIPGLRAPPAA